jgi:hypothetical protein
LIARVTAWELISTDSAEGINLTRTYSVLCI